MDRKELENWILDLLPGQTLYEKYIEECKSNNVCTHLDNKGKLNLTLISDASKGIYQCANILCGMKFNITLRLSEGGLAETELYKATEASRQAPKCERKVKFGVNH